MGRIGRTWPSSGYSQVKTASHNTPVAGDITLKYIDQELLPEVKLIWRSSSQLQKRARVELFWLSVFAAVDLGDLIDLRLVTRHYERGVCANFRKKARSVQEGTTYREMEKKIILKKGE